MLVLPTILYEKHKPVKRLQDCPSIRRQPSFPWKSRIAVSFQNIPLRNLLVSLHGRLPGWNSRLKVVINLLEFQVSRPGIKNNCDDQYDEEKAKIEITDIGSHVSVIGADHVGGPERGGKPENGIYCKCEGLTVSSEPDRMHFCGSDQDDRRCM